MKLLASITFTSALLLGMSNAIFTPSTPTCSEIKSMVTEYFDESIVNDMMCIAIHEISNPKSDSLGLFNLKKEYCNSLCKSICHTEKDLMDSTLNTRCAEIVYLENGLREWDSYNKDQCNGSWEVICDIKDMISRPHTSSTRDGSSSTHDSSSSTRDSSSSSGTSGSGTSGTSGSNTGQTGHFIPGQSGHGMY